MNGNDELQQQTEHWSKLPSFEFNDSFWYVTVDSNVPSRCSAGSDCWRFTYSRASLC